MNKNEFINKLEKTLVANEVPDIDDIVYEYEQHFDFKIEDGYSESDIAAKLGDPVALANQFSPEKPSEKSLTKIFQKPLKKSSGILLEKPLETELEKQSEESIKTINANPIQIRNKNFIAASLFFADLFAILLFIPLFAWVAIIGTTAISSLITSGLLMSGSNFQNLLPSMPYASAFLFSIVLLLFALLAGIGTIYCFLFFKQLIRAYVRWHKNVMSPVSGRPVYPALAKYPRFVPRIRRRFRTITLAALTLFVLFFISAYAVSALSAGALGFWHAWGWFL